MAKCLVLGANGFIGSHLVDALVARGNSVRAFDRFGGETLFNESDQVEVMRGDFLNRASLVEALQGVDYVFHFISTTTPASAENDPLIDIETNIRMSVELFQACVEVGTIKRLIFASTGGAIYGNIGDTRYSEQEMPQPVSPYAIGKLTIEQYLRYFKVKHGLDSVVLRISNPYGERQPLNRKQGVIPIFLEQISQGQPITVLGDGSMVRDYIYVKDVATMVASMFDKPAAYDVYNLGSGTGVSLNELVAAVEAASGQKADVQHQAAPPTYVQRVTLDTSRFNEAFGIRPETSLSEGLKNTLDYINDQLGSSHEA